MNRYELYHILAIDQLSVRSSFLTTYADDNVKTVRDVEFWGNPAAGFQNRPRWLSSICTNRPRWLSSR